MPGYIPPVMVPDRPDRERYDGKEVSPVHHAATEPVSTFSLDVDTGSYANVRRLINATRYSLAGLATAFRMRGEARKVVAVVGDGAMTAGLSFEALNSAGHLKKNMLIILNDNEMSISPNVGAISKYLTRVTTTDVYNKFESDVWDLLSSVQLGR